MAISAIEHLLLRIETLDRTVHEELSLVKKQIDLSIKGASDLQNATSNGLHSVQQQQLDHLSEELHEGKDKLIYHIDKTSGIDAAQEERIKALEREVYAKPDA